MSTLGVIIVSWNTCELLCRCLDSLAASFSDSGIAGTVVVVDNGSTDGTPALLRARYPGVRLIEAGRNLGFAGGNNLALRLLLDRSIRGHVVVDNWQLLLDNCKTTINNLDPDYVLLLNPDTEVVGDAIPRLVRYLENHADVALVGPQLRYPDGSRQPSRRRFPTPGVFFWESTPLELRWPGNPWARRYRCADRSDDVEQEVDWLVGAALLVRRSAIERAGLLDSGFVMYSEELEWQQRIRSVAQRAPNAADVIAQYPARIVYLPDAVVIHHEGKSSEQAIARRYLNFHRSRLRYARMIYGEPFAALLRVFLRVAYAAELALEAGKWLLGHKRALRAQRVGVYWQVVRGLRATGP
jgi:N-acetylglucosaminyl-diphospho-decaprenol L-rhamnosyltransferase